MSSVATIDFTGGGIRNSDIGTGAAIAATKLEHQFSIDRQLYAEGTEIVALASELLHIVHGTSGEVVAFEGAIFTQATGADRTVDVALQKSTGAGAFATIMTTNVEITNTTAVRTPVAAVVSNTALVDGDILRAVVTVAGSADAQAEGLLITLTLREDPA